MKKSTSRLVFLTSVLPNSRGDTAQKRAYAFLIAYAQFMHVELFIEVENASKISDQLDVEPCLEIQHTFFDTKVDNMIGYAEVIVASIKNADHLHLFRPPFIPTHSSVFWDFDLEGERLALASGLDESQIILTKEKCDILFYKNETGMLLDSERTIIVRDEDSYDKVLTKICLQILGLTKGQKIKLQSEVDRMNQIQYNRLAFIPDKTYRTPSIMPIEPPSLILISGSCMTEDWDKVINNLYPNTKIHHQLFNNGSELEDLPEDTLAAASFQIVHIPLRALLGEAEYFSIDLTSRGSNQILQIFNSVVQRLRRSVKAALKYNRAVGLPIFILNFAKPQANPLGRLLPRYDLSNFNFFIEEINKEMYFMIKEEKSVYLIDFDEITANLGKRYIQDDLTSHLNHSGFMFETHNQYDQHLTPFGSMMDLYRVKTLDATLAIFNECIAAHHTLTSSSKIKIVVFDLDGTLWRGVPADGDDIGSFLTEGWPLSILEAAAFLKKRGILIALASKNDPDKASYIWEQLYGHTFELSNFVSIKFSWGAKADSIAEILEETNLLPENCLFVDDNPVELERVKVAFPEIKIITGPIYTWRRTLLWGTELQIPFITDESLHRTESVRGMMKRNALKAEVDEETFLKDLNVSIRFETITSSLDIKFQRAIELINKTNQFNTIGKRWAAQEINLFFNNGGTIIVAHVSDRMTDYGLTAVLLVQAAECVQLVMSCRVFGLRVEYALIKEFLRNPRSEKQFIRFIDTGKNKLCRTFLKMLAIQPPNDYVSNGGICLELPSDKNLWDVLTGGIKIIDH